MSTIELKAEDLYDKVSPPRRPLRSDGLASLTLLAAFSPSPRIRSADLARLCAFRNAQDKVDLEQVELEDVWTLLQ